MITEIAQIDVKPGTEKDFEAASPRQRRRLAAPKAFTALSCIARSKNRSVID